MSDTDKLGISSVNELPDRLFALMEKAETANDKLIAIMLEILTFLRVFIEFRPQYLYCTGETHLAGHVFSKSVVIAVNTDAIH